MIPISDGSQEKIRFACPRCPGNGKHQPTPGEHDAPDLQSHLEDPRDRFRRLLASDEASKDIEMPDWLIEDLPAEARRILQKDRDKIRPSIGPQLSNDLAQALRDQGYVIDEDSHGLRIGGNLTSRGQDPGKMSPYDILRMASDLDGGIQKHDELRRCPHCDAVLPRGQTRFDWCGTSVE
jgi:hypothetical protein